MIDCAKTMLLGIFDGEMLRMGLFNHSIKTRLALLGVPWSRTFVREEELDLFKRLVAGLEIASVDTVASGGSWRSYLPQGM